MTSNIVFISCLWGIGRENLHCNVLTVDQRVLNKPNCRAGSIPQFINYFDSDVRVMTTPGTVMVYTVEFSVQKATMAFIEKIRLVIHSLQDDLK